MRKLLDEVNNYNIEIKHMESLINTHSPAVNVEGLSEEVNKIIQKDLLDTINDYKKTIEDLTTLRDHTMKKLKMYTPKCFLQKIENIKKNVLIFILVMIFRVMKNAHYYKIIYRILNKK
jgi:hypothetical protein